MTSATSSRAARLVVGPELDRNARAHEIHRVADPLGARGKRDEQHKRGRPRELRDSA